MRVFQLRIVIGIHNTNLISTNVQNQKVGNDHNILENQRFEIQIKKSENQHSKFKKANNKTQHSKSYIKDTIPKPIASNIRIQNQNLNSKREFQTTQTLEITINQNENTFKK